VTYTYDRRLIAKDVIIDVGLIEKLRKDFLTLMKNVPRVHDYATAHELDDAFRIYNARFKDLFFEHFLNRDFKYDNTISDGDRRWFDKELRKTGWDLYIEMRVPISRADDYYSEEARFREFTEQSPRWANRVKDKARTFWAAMKSFLEWYQRTRDKTEYTVKVPGLDQVEMEGFKVIVEGYDENDERARDYMERFKEGLRVFRRRAAQVLPLMLHHMLPIKVIAWSRALDEGGRYLGPSQPLEFTLDAFFDDKNAQRVAQVIAHEMGHHLHRSYLSAADRTFWDGAIRGDYEPIDLQKLLAQWPESMSYASDFSESIRESDPDLSIAVDAAYWTKQVGMAGFTKREEAAKLLADGDKFFAPKNPITPYASKNSEEAFCEAVGMLVGYGPHAVPAVVKHWLGEILPGIRVSRTLVRDALHRVV